MSHGVQLSVKKVSIDDRNPVSSGMFGNFMMSLNGSFVDCEPLPAHLATNLAIRAYNLIDFLSHGVQLSVKKRFVEDGNPASPGTFGNFMMSLNGF